MRPQLHAGGTNVFTKLFEYAQSHFLELITSVPTLIESYEVVDANGASARRYMINDPQSHLETEARPESLQASEANREQNSAQQNQDGSTSYAKGLSGEAGREGDQDAEQSATQRDLAYMQRRYRSKFASTSSATGKLIWVVFCFLESICMSGICSSFPGLSLCSRLHGSLSQLASTQL